MSKKSLFLVIFGLLGGSATFAELSVGPVYLDRFPELDVVVEPQGVEAEALGGIQASDLELLEDGVATSRATAVRPFGETEWGIALVIAVDVSGTMTGSPMEGIKSALSSLVGELRPQDQMTLVTFADEFRQEIGFTSDQAQLLETIGTLEGRGRITELFKALFKSLALLDDARLDGPDLPRRRRLLVVSDGKDEGEAYELDDVIDRARELRVPVDAVGLTRIDPKYLSQLERLADLSFGSYATASQASDLEALFRQGLGRLRATPVATFEASRLPADSQPHRVGVRWWSGGNVVAGEVETLMPAPPPPAEGPDEDPDPATDSDRTALLVGGGAGGLLLLVLLWMLLRRRRRPAPVPVVEAPQEAPIEMEPPMPPTRDEAPDFGAALLPRQEDERQEDEPPAPVQARRPRKTQYRMPFNPPTAGHPAAHLKGVDGPLEGETWGVEDDPFWIGTDEANQLRIEGDDFASGHHACIRFHEGSLLLYDNNATNGTFLNEERLSDTPRPLTVGDRVRLGRTSFVILAPQDLMDTDGDADGYDSGDDQVL